MLQKCPVFRNMLLTCAFPWSFYSPLVQQFHSSWESSSWDFHFPFAPPFPAVSVLCGVYCRADVSAWQCPLGSWLLLSLFVFPFFLIIWYNLICSGLLPPLKFICMSLKWVRKHFSYDSVVQTDLSQEVWQQWRLFLDENLHGLNQV